MTATLKVRCSRCGTKIAIHLEADDKYELDYLRKDAQIQKHLCDTCRNTTGNAQ